MIIVGFETASLPTTSETLRKHLLNFAVVGGGRKYCDPALKMSLIKPSATGIEFSAELHDLINEDLIRIYPVSYKIANTETDFVNS